MNWDREAPEEKVRKTIYTTVVVHSGELHDLLVTTSFGWRFTRRKATIDGALSKIISPGSPERVCVFPVRYPRYCTGTTEL